MWWCGAAIVVRECASCHGPYIGATCDKQTTTYHCRQQSASVFPGNWYSRSLLYWFVRASVERVSVCVWTEAPSVRRTQPKFHTNFAHFAVIPTFPLSVSFQAKQMDFSLVSQNTVSHSHTHADARTPYPRRRSDEKTKHIYVYIHVMAIVCLVGLLLCLKCVCARGHDAVLVRSQQGIIATVTMFNCCGCRTGDGCCGSQRRSALRQTGENISKRFSAFQFLFFPLCDAVIDNSHWCNRQTPPLSLATGKRYLTWHKIVMHTTMVFGVRCRRVQITVRHWQTYQTE